MQKLRWSNNIITLNNSIFYQLQSSKTEEQLIELYKHLKCNYPKFYKMDIASKVGFLATEILLYDIDMASIDNKLTATYITTSVGCSEVDNKYQETLSDLASPALFVYTLPNIVLGEICIRHKFKGEQLVTIVPKINKEEINFYLRDIFTLRNYQHCLCGHIDANSQKIDVEIYWINKKDETL